MAPGCTNYQIAKNLGVDRSTVARTVELFLTTGSVSKKAYPEERAFSKLTDPAIYPSSSNSKAGHIPQRNPGKIVKSSIT